MNSIIEPCHAMSAVMEDVPMGTTAERTCQSPRSESQSRHARPRREVSLSSSPNGGQRGAFSQPERAKSADTQRIKILKCLQMGGGNTTDAELTAGFRLVVKESLVYVFEASIITFIVFTSAKVQRFFETTKCLADFFAL